MKKKKNLFKPGIIIVSISIVVIFCLQIIQLSREKQLLYRENLDRENWQRKMEWFGTGGGYKISGSSILQEEMGVTYANIYGPEMLQGIQVWEESGIAGWLAWDEKEVRTIEMKIEEEIRKRADSDKLQIRIKKLLKGDSTMEGGIGIMKMTDMNQFEYDIELIQSAYKEVHWNDPVAQWNINIRSEWINYISEQ